MVASEEVKEVVKGLQKLNVEEQSQLFTLVPSLWESIPVESMLDKLSQEEDAVRHSTEYRLDRQKQKRLKHLLGKNRSQKMLTADEEVELDQLIAESDDLMLLKAQTLYALKSLAKRLSEHMDAKW